MGFGGAKDRLNVCSDAFGIRSSTLGAKEAKRAPKRVSAVTRLRTPLPFVPEQGLKMQG